jgi:hypothetical protein
MLDAIDNRTELRLQLLRQGYTPLLNIDKTLRHKGWATERVDEALIRSWSRSRRVSTGLRVENGLVAIDCDAPNDGLAQAMWRLMPKGALRRVGNPPKWMTFRRLVGQAPYRIVSREWTDGAKQQLEIFTGRKQVGAFGWHTEGKRLYVWQGPSLADVPLAELPTVDINELRKLCSAFDELAKQVGAIEVVADKAPAGGCVFDITEATRFSDNHGRFGLTYAELENGYYEAARDGSSYRTASPWTGDGTNTEKCWVFKHPAYGCIAVYDHRSNLTHLPVEAKAAATPSVRSLLREVGNGLAAGRFEEGDMFK